MNQPEPAAATTLYLKRKFAAPRDAVFAAMTDPEKVKEWFRPPNITHPKTEIDLRVGGEYRFTLQRGDIVFHLVGTYLEIEPPERLSYTFRWDPPLLDLMDTGDSLVTLEFHDLGGETEVVLVHEKLRDEEMRQFHEGGWTDVFDRLVEVVAAEPAS